MASVDVHIAEIIAEFWHQIDTLVAAHNVVVHGDIHDQSAGDSTKQKSGHGDPRQVQVEHEQARSSR